MNKRKFLYKLIVKEIIKIFLDLNSNRGETHHYLSVGAYVSLMTAVNLWF